jgi:transposase, IS5 family
LSSRRDCSCPLLIGIPVEHIDGAGIPPVFRHLHEANQLAPKILDQINPLLADKGLILREGTIVDAMLRAAPPSTKNKDITHAPEMHQANKGNQWHFGMETHVGVDVISGLTHTAVRTAANVSDVAMAGQLLRSDDKIVFAYAGFTGAAKRPENGGKDVNWQVA